MEYKAWKVKTILNMVKQQCISHMPVPGEFISIDEAMIKYYGKRCPITKSMPAKPIKKGFLLFCAVDYATKFVFDFNLSDNSLTAEMFKDVPWGLSGQRVIDLVKNLKSKWHVVVVDNYYDSEPLAIEMKEHRCQYVLGTLRKNRLPSGKPAEFVYKAKNPKPSRAIPKGTLKCCVRNTNDIACYSFMDSSVVYILDSAYGPRQKTEMVRRIGNTTTTFDVYKGISWYNKYMGGVDAADALRTGYYAVDGQGRAAKWTVRFVDAMFNFQLSQAWVTYRHHHGDSVGKYGRLQFYLEICGAFLDNDEGTNDPAMTRQASEKNITDEFGKHHNMTKTKEISSKVRVDKKARLHSDTCCYCDLIKKRNNPYVSANTDPRTTYTCLECNKYVHPECFGAYHNHLCSLK